MKFGLFKHGGHTRNILSIEIGRAAIRDDKVENSGRSYRLRAPVANRQWSLERFAN